jgi:senataxin
LTDGRHQYARSLFERLAQRTPAAVAMLTIQYRMHPRIASFPSRRFYGERLLTETGGRAEPPLPALGPLHWLDVADGVMHAPQHASVENWQEAEVVVALVRALRTVTANGAAPPLSIGVVAPYRAQVELLRQRLFLADAGLTQTGLLEVQTVVHRRTHQPRLRLKLTCYAR